MITIEQDAFSTTSYHAGVYKNDNEEEYEFTIAVSSSELNDEDTLLEVSWVDGEPEDKSVFHYIWENWSDYIGKTE